jgi:hypothetical protein
MCIIHHQTRLIPMGEKTAISMYTMSFRCSRCAIIPSGYMCFRQQPTRFAALNTVFLLSALQKSFQVSLELLEGA